MTDVLQTKRLSLRKLASSDVDAITGQISDLDVCRWLTKVPYPYTCQDAEAFLEHCGGSDWHFAVVRDGDLIGVMSCDDQLGYWIGKSFWGQGYATEAAEAVVDHRFRATDCDAVMSGYHDGNAASCRVLEKLAFRPSGKRTAQSVTLKKDVEIMGMKLSRTDWEARP